jgi:hypothetical protein
VQLPCAVCLVRDRLPVFFPLIEFPREKTESFSFRSPANAETVLLLLLLLFTK